MHPAEAPDVASAMRRWPNVPACYGWLSLDQRGRWRLRGEVVVHAGLIAYINQRYGCDAGGRWLMQNGPQRVYVRLDYTPWVLRLDTAGALTTHTGQPVAQPTAAYLDEHGNLLLIFELGVGVIDDRDLAQALPDITDESGAPVSDERLLAFFACAADEACEPLFWRGLPIARMQSKRAADALGYIDDPQEP